MSTETRLQWIKIGADTWQIGKFRVYRSLMPEPVYWVSSGSGRPERMDSREAVIERVTGERDA